VVVSAGRLKMREWKNRHGRKCRGWKRREWKHRHDFAGVENAGVETSARFCRGGKCRSGKIGTDRVENAGVETSGKIDTAECYAGVEKRMVRLISREIILEEFQRISSQSTNVTNRRTDRRTTYHGTTALCYASNGYRQKLPFLLLAVVISFGMLHETKIIMSQYV